MYLGWLFWWRPPYVLRSVIVNFRDDVPAIGGVLWASRGPFLTLKQAVLDPANRKVAIDGDVVVERARLAFVQVVG
jgi:hypothetical protein